jgi:predicted dehydrogenase
MNTRKSLNRRQFLQTASALAISVPTLIPSSVWAAKAGAKPSERIRLGFIGLGTQNRGHLHGFLANSDVQVMAVAEVDRDRRESARQMADEYYAQAKAAGKYHGCGAYNDFRELLARSDVDAVVIATPDHWHAITVIQAAKAGKDIYVEKPMSLTIGEARAMVKAVRKYNRVCQVGSQQRSSSEFRRACELVRNHRIGEVKAVYVNIGGPSKPCDLPTQPMQPGLDWDMWLGPAPVRGYHEVLSPRGVHKHFPDWRAYIEYSGGGMTDWGAHHFDIAQWGLGMDNSGPVEIHPPDGHDFKTLTYRYANGTVMYRDGLKDYPFGVVFVGEKGKVCVDRGKFQTDPESIAQEPLGPNDLRLYKSDSHHQDWIQCIRSRQKPICDVEVGCRSVTVCHLGNLAYWHNRSLKWDPVKEKFPGDKEANSWIDRPKRAPWKL